MPTRRNDRRSKPEYQVKIAKERINILMNEAMAAQKENPEMSKRYFILAKKIGMRYNVLIPGNKKRKFCKKCFSFLSEGWRFKGGQARVTCKNCGQSMRYPYKPFRSKKKNKRTEHR
ncbi:ribonuclease P [archaeon]|nr:ribonuclease P [archaeon]